MPKCPKSKLSANRVDQTICVNTFLCQLDARKKIGTENPKCVQISVSGSVFGFLVRKTPMHVMNEM